MERYKNKKLLKQFGDRLKEFRIAANLSLAQIHAATGISKTQILRTESGTLNTTLSHISLYADLYGMGVHGLLDFNDPVPDEAVLRQNIKKFLKAQGGIDPGIFFKHDEGATNVIITKLLKTNFLNVPRFTREIANFCNEKYKISFSTTVLSRVLDKLQKKGILERLTTDKKSKFQYRKISV